MRYALFGCLGVVSLVLCTGVGAGATYGAIQHRGGVQAMVDDIAPQPIVTTNELATADFLMASALEPRGDSPRDDAAAAPEADEEEKAPAAAPTAKHSSSRSHKSSNSSSRSSSTTTSSKASSGSSNSKAAAAPSTDSLDDADILGSTEPSAPPPASADEEDLGGLEDDLRDVESDAAERARESEKARGRQKH